MDDKRFSHFPFQYCSDDSLRVLICAESQNDNISEECASSIPECQNYVQVDKEVKYKTESIHSSEILVSVT